MVNIPKGKRVTGVMNAMTGESIPFEVTDISEDFERLVTMTFICDIAPFSHKLYNIDTESGQQEITVTANEGLKKGGTVTGKGYSMTVGENGEIVSLTTASGQKIISAEGLYLTGNFFSIKQKNTGSMQRSSMSIAAVYEGDVSTRIIAAGSIGEQETTIIITIYAELPYFDIKILANIDIDCGIGTYTDYQWSSWGLAGDNLLRNKLNINFRPDFQLGGSYAGDTLSTSYPLYDYTAYNDAVNVSRYTPFYPEKYQRRSESATLTGGGAGRVNHVYNIVSRYYFDVSSTNSDRGLSMLVKGGVSFTYDGNTLGCVMGVSSEWVPIAMASMGARYNIAGESYTGNLFWDFRALAHDQIDSATEVRLSGGDSVDLLKEGLGYNNPLIVDIIEKTSGALPAEYQYLSPNLADGVVISSLSVRNGEYFVRAFEYNGRDAGEFSMDFGGRAAIIRPVSMDFKHSRDVAGISLTPYKIGTYSFTAGGEIIEGTDETDEMVETGETADISAAPGNLGTILSIVGGAAALFAVGAGAMIFAFKKKA